MSDAKEDVKPEMIKIVMECTGENIEFEISKKEFAILQAEAHTKGITLEENINNILRKMVEEDC